MKWFRRKPTQQKYVDAVIKVASNLYLRTLPEATEEPAPLEFGLVDSRFRYLIFCLSTVITAALARRDAPIRFAFLFPHAPIREQLSRQREATSASPGAVRPLTACEPPGRYTQRRKGQRQQCYRGSRIGHRRRGHRPCARTACCLANGGTHVRYVDGVEGDINGLDFIISTRRLDVNRPLRREAGRASGEFKSGEGSVHVRYGLDPIEE